MSEQPSIGKRVEEYVTKKFDEGYDFKNSKKRLDDFKLWADAEKINFNSAKAEFYRILESVVKQKGLNRTDFFQVRQTKEKPRPGEQRVNTTYDKKSPSEQNSQQQNNENNKNNNSQQEQKDSSQQEQTTDIPWEMCYMPFEALITIMHSRHESIPLLKDEEKEIMGKAWQPVFAKLFGKEWFKYFMAGMVTLGVMTPRIKQYSELSKEEKKKSESKKEENKEPSEKRQESKLDPATRATIIDDLTKKGIDPDLINKKMQEFEG
ncbi:MAG: hypothetical protein KGI08_04940 [Thaumarchaeota archaeon]|nr:hypothetical protein [Nitrososphaerota archaeon]MDE1867041.1 hypothetical protein [Nitrososphaerota archaeon]